MKVTNNHTSALALPDGTHIPAGQARNVPGWDKIKNHDVVKAWVAAAVIVPEAETGDDKPDDSKASSKSKGKKAEKPADDSGSEGDF